MAGRKAEPQREESDHMYYTTESGNTAYETGTGTSKLDSFTSGGDTLGSLRYETYDSGDPTYDSAYYDRDTLFITNGGKKKNRKYVVPADPPIRQRRGSPRRYSPAYHPSSDMYNYYIEEETVGRKRTKHGRGPERDIYIPRQEAMMDKDITGKRRRNHMDYSEENDLNYSFNDNEGNGEFIHEEYEDRSGKKKRLRTEKKKDYQVYAYHEPKQRDTFINKNGGSKTTLMSPGMEMKTFEYPVLAFKVVSPKENALHNDSETVYLPVLEVNKKTKTLRTVSYNKRNQNDKENPKQMENIQVYAANLNQQKNIFQAYTDEVNKNKQNDNKDNKVEHSNKTDTIKNHDVTGFNSGSFPYSLFSDVPMNAPLTKDDNATKDASMMGKRDILNYQINIDVANDNKNVFDDNKPISTTRKSTVTRKSNVTPETELKKIYEDKLHDDYPVTKDYIKVSDNNAEQYQRKSVRQSVASSRAQSVSKPVNIEDTTKQSSMQADNPSFVDQAALDGKFENGKTAVKSKFSLLYGEPMKNPILNQQQTEERKSILEPVSGARKSQVVNTGDLRQSLALKKSMQEIRNSTASHPRKSFANLIKSPVLKGQELQKEKKEVEDVDQSSKDIQNINSQQNNQRHSTITSRLSHSKTKPRQSGDYQSVSAAVQDNRYSTADGAPGRTSAIKPMETPDNRQSSRVESGLNNERQTSKETKNEISEPVHHNVDTNIEHKIRKSFILDDTNKPKNSKESRTSLVENKKTRSDTEMKPTMNMRSIANALVTASKLKPHSRGHVPVSPKKSPNSVPTRKSLVQDKHSALMHRGEPIATAGKQHTQLREEGSGTHIANARSSRFSLGHRKSEILGKKSKSILSKKILRGQSKDRGKNSHGKRSMWNLFKKKEKTVSEEEEFQPQNDFSILYPEKHEDIEQIQKQMDVKAIEKPCDCVTKYIILFRECIHFFLGRSIHEQVMDVLKAI